MTSAAHWGGAISRDRLFNPDRRSPAEVLMGVQVNEIGADWLAGEMTWGPEAARDFSLGQLGVLVDIVCGRAVIVRLAPGQGCRTASLRIDALDEVPHPGDRITVRARAHTLGPAFAVTNAEVRAADGRLVALVTGRFAVVSEAPAGDQGAPCAPTDLPLQPSPLVPLHAQHEADRSLLTFRPDPRLANPRDHVHGGIHALFAEAALTSAVNRGAEGPARLLDLTLTYHRPIVIDGSEISVEGVVERRGRRLVVAAATMRSAAGKVLSTAHANLGLSP